MHLNSGIVVAAAVFRVAQADFMVYTVPPIPTDSIPKFIDAAEASGWSLSVAMVANSVYDSLTKELGAPYSSSQSSVASEIRAFVQSTHNYSIPAEVTERGAVTTFFSKPDWYDALPTDAKAFKELQVSDQISVVSSVIASGTTTASLSSTRTTVTGAAGPTAHAFLDAKFGAMAAAAAAVFL